MGKNSTGLQNPKHFKGRNPGHREVLDDRFAINAGELSVGKNGSNVMNVPDDIDAIAGVNVERDDFAAIKERTRGGKLLIVISTNSNRENGAIYRLCKSGAEDGVKRVRSGPRTIAQGR
jgi:hypothetical protein